MKFKLITLIISTLLSVTIFSILSSNSYAFFKENQEKLFIEDNVMIKVLDGEKYKSVADIVELFDSKQLNYVLYYMEDDTFFILNHNYDNMINLKISNGLIVDQTINGYNYQQLDLNTKAFEIFIAVEDFSEDELISLFTDANSMTTDGTVGLFSQGYEGILSTQLYLVFMILVIVVNYMYFSLFLQSQKESIGICKLLGYTTSTITKKYVKELFIYYLISIITVYLFNYNFLNFMFTQKHVFQDIIGILFIYLISIVANVFVCGAIINYYVNKLSTIRFLREVSHD